MSTNINVPINSIYTDVKLPGYGRWLALKDDSYKKYREKWYDNPRRFMVERFPLHMDIEPTNVCHLRCPMCQTVVVPTKGGKGPGPKGFMEFSLFEKIMSDIAIEGGGVHVPSIKLSNWGEPLLHPRIVDMISFAKKAGVIDVALNTSATMLTPDLSEAILDAGLDGMFFSFDAATKATYETMRAGANFEETLRNIRNFVRIRDMKNAYRTLVRVSVVLTDANRHEADKTAELFSDTADVISFNKEFRNLDPVSNEEVFDPLTRKMRYSRNHNYACSFLWQRLRIHWDGSIGLCNNDYNEKMEDINIRAHTVESLWQRDRMTHFRRLHQNGEWWHESVCRTCPYPYFSII